MGPTRSLQSDAFFGELKRCVGFDKRDAAGLGTLGPVLEQHLPRVVEGVIREMNKFSGVQAFFQNDPARQSRVSAGLLDWLRSLFSGAYEAAYLRRRLAIGRLHHRVGIEQHYIFTAMDIIRRQFRKIISDTGVARHKAKLEALEKLLVLENILLAGSYQDAQVKHVRTREHDAVQERLTQTEHLAEIGRLAASLAHEIKNPLAGISGAIQVIRDSMPPENAHRGILVEVLRQINRLDQTVKDLLVYARPAPPRFDKCRIDRVVERLTTMLRSEPALQCVRFEHRGEKRQPPIEADDHQLEQLLMNLVLNAAHASADGGLVVLRTQLTSKGLRLEVEDHGQGMDEDTCRRALAPFYTTKARGTGLGLPICERIVKAHHGTFVIRSQVKKGTTVSMHLPLRQPAQPGVKFG